MPLIKIWNFDRTVKKMIQASSLHALIEQGAIKLGYSNQCNLKVLIESDGTDVDSEEIFSALISENMFPSTVLMLLPHEYIWSDSSTSLSASVIPFSLPASASQSEPPAEAALVFDSTVSPVFTIPYMDFPKKLKADCDKSKMPEKSLILKMIRVVSKALMKFNSLPSRSLTAAVAQDIVAKYPILGTPNVGDTLKAYETIFTKLESCIQNMRRPIKKLEKQYSEGINKVEKSRPKKDQYGCVRWQPILFDTETPESQEITRKSLLESYENPSDRKDVAALMSETYATQRLLINSKALISGIQKSWPYLFKEQYFINHANELLGLNLLCVWNESLSKVPSLMFYFRTLRKRNKTMDKLLCQIEEEVMKQQSRLSESSALVKLLTTYFGEEESQILNYFDVATSLDEIRMKRENDSLMHPSICILGNSLLHNSKGYLLVESVLLGDLANVVDLIPILFASYYVFNLCYPPGAEATLEFLQREFFKINPPGHKRGGKKKRTTVHPKVSTLLVNLQHHTSQWGHEDDSDIYASD